MATPQKRGNTRTIIADSGGNLRLEVAPNFVTSYDRTVYVEIRIPQNKGICSVAIRGFRAHVHKSFISIQDYKRIDLNCRFFLCVALLRISRSTHAPLLGPQQIMRDKRDENRNTENYLKIRVFRGFWWCVIACDLGAEERT